MRALVTGASGFLGSRLVRALVAAGHTVGALARPHASFDQLADLLPQLARYPVDDGPDTIRRALVDCAPEVVFHLATYYARDHRAADVLPLIDANITLPLRLIDAMVREGVRRFVNTGSAWQNFESTGYRPVCLHSATKQACEDLIAFFVDAGALDCITLRMHDTYGPGDPRRKIFTLLREHAGAPLPLALSGGEQSIDLIHVDDAVAAYERAAEILRSPGRACAHEVYSASGGDPRPLREVVERFLRLARLDVPIAWGARPYHPREVMTPWATGARLPGWEPRITLDEGLRELAVAARAVNSAVV